MLKQTPTKTILALFAVSLVACVSPDDDDEGIDDVAGGKADGFGVTEAEGRGILRVANEVSRADLIGKAKVSKRAVAGIDEHRLGGDGIAGTADDDAFDTLDALDAIPYVGTRAFDKLLAYADRLGWVDEDVGSHQLDGFDETLLAADSSGRLAVLRVGAAFSRAALPPPAARPPEVVRSHGGKFYLLYEDSNLLIVDPVQAKIERTIDLPVAEPADLEWATTTSIYVSSKTANAIVKVDLETGAELGSIDLASLRIAGGTIEPRRLLRVGDRLFVQVARTQASGRADRGALAVVDTTRDEIEKVIELEVQDPTSGAMMPGLEPAFAMAWDAKRNKVFVSLAGVRPSNTGMLIRIDPETLAVHDFKRARAGFQGAVAFGEPFSKLFVIYHTSTPTTSSHLFVDLVAEDGKLTSAGGGTLVDTFDGLDALAINNGGTLVTMANTCLTGFCTTGAGLSFVDATTSAVLPKLLADQIGFEPMMVRFL